MMIVGAYWTAVFKNVKSLKLEMGDCNLIIFDKNSDWYKKDLYNLMYFEKKMHNWNDLTLSFAVPGKGYYPRTDVIHTD